MKQSLKKRVLMRSALSHQWWNSKEIGVGIFLETSRHTYCIGGSTKKIFFWLKLLISVFSLMHEFARWCNLSESRCQRHMFTHEYQNIRSSSSFSLGIIIAPCDRKLFWEIHGLGLCQNRRILSHNWKLWKLGIGSSTNYERVIFYDRSWLAIIAHQLGRTAQLRCDERDSFDRWNWQ